MPFASTPFRAARTAFLLLLLAALVAASADATTFRQAGFSEAAVFTGLTNPTVVRFLPDGRVLVAEKSGLLKLFPNLTTNTYTVVGDLRTGTHNFWDRGLLGLAVPPGFDSASPDEWRRYVYVLYTHDAAIGGTAPRWGTPGAFSDPCPAPPAGPGATTDGCVVSGRLSRLPADGTNWTEPGEEEVLLEDWCQQYPSHSTGALDFGVDEKLYVSGGDGASFNAADWGQFGGTIQVQGSPGTYYTPANPCADPPFALGTPQTKPTARGGALRSQSPLRPAGEARLLNGAILRVDPATGDALPDNPLFASSDPNEQRTIGYGLRNPFRMIVRPGTNEVWVGDVGWNAWEELNRIPDLSTARNFGWPCYEGNGTQYTGFNLCPAQAQTDGPLLTYHHSASLVAGDGCSTGSSSIAGMAFYQGASNYPPAFDDALFLSDYSRKCMWVMFPDGSGQPDPATTAAFASSVSSGPVDLQLGPDGNIYYVDFNGGRIMRIKYGLNAVATANPTAGTAPLNVAFNGSATTPAQGGDTLTYAWDLDGDGEYDDSAAVSPSNTYSPGNYVVRLRVTDQRGAIDFSDPIAISAGNTAPTAVIDTPATSLAWMVNDTITFAGHAFDPQETGGSVPAANLNWVVRIQHCPSNCHAHTYQTFSGVEGGSFAAPDHEYPAYLQIELTATDSQGLTDTTTIDIQPQTVSLQFQTAPGGLQLSVGTFTGTAPFNRTVIRGSSNAVDALAPQGAFPNIWEFVSWSDAGAEQHTIVASASGTYTATYATRADLSISASAAPEPVGAGAPLTYTLNVANSGPSQAGSVAVTHTLPAGAALQSASGDGWVCAGAAPVTCTTDALGLGAAAPITVVVAAPAEGGAIAASSAVSSVTSDPSAANNSASAPSTVFARADLSITQTGAPAAICVGQPITYTLNVANAGPSAATSISVSDVLPSGASLVSAAGPGWTCAGAPTVTCTRDTLAAGAAAPITVAIAGLSAGTATNTAAISSSTSDPSAANNSSAVSTDVNTIPSPPAAGNGGAVCAGATLQLTATTVPGATYAWTGPNGFTSTLQNPTIPDATPAASGTYSVTVTVEGCTSSAASTNALVRATPTAVVTGGATICAGDAAQISAALTGTGPWNVTWSDGLVQSVGVSPAHRSVSPSQTTTYTVTTVHDAFCAAAGSGSAEIVVGNPIETPEITAPLFAAVGAGGLAASVESHDGSTYAWTLSAGTITSGQGTSAITFDVAAPGTTMVISVVETNTACSSPAATREVQVDFLDVPPSHMFHDYVGTLALSGVTAGCGSGNFCPSASNTREQMAVFLLKSKFGADHVPPAATGVFSDVPAESPFAPWVEEVAALEISVGCGGGRFCPQDPVTRAQMAVFLLKTLLGSGYVPPAASGTLFADVPAGAFAAAWIEDLYGRGITGGCQASPLLYCPSTPVTRGQMAVFLVRTFGL